MGYRIGLDIGIEAIGWSVIKNDENGNPVRIIDLGTRVFDTIENPKNGVTYAKERRINRGIRRKVRRKKHRIERTKRLLDKYGIIAKKAIEDMYNNKKYMCNIYELRVRALDEMITNEELARILISMVKKRGYKSVRRSDESKSGDAGKILVATKENEILMQMNQYRSVAEMYIKDDRFKLKDKNDEVICNDKGNIQIKVRNTIGSYKNIVFRKFLVDEIKLILNKQKEFNSNITDEFINEYLDIFLGQRYFEEGPGSESPYSGNQIEKLLGFCPFEKNKNKAPKSSYTFEYFKLLQTLNHIKIDTTIFNEDGSKRIERIMLNEEQRTKIKELMFSKSTVSFYDIRKILELSNYQRFNMVNYKDSIDYSESEIKKAEKSIKLNELESYNKIKNALNKVEKNYIEKLSVDELDTIGYALTVYKNDEKIIYYLKENTQNLNDDAINELLALSFSKVGKLSIKAMKKIIPELERGITYNKAIELVYKSESGIQDGDKVGKLKLEYLDDLIVNPIMKRAVSQTVKVLNAITSKYNPIYGKTDVMVIKCSKEFDKTFKERKEIEKSREKNDINNERIRECIKELGKDEPTGKDIMKYKLWEEQNGICIYSGKRIHAGDLFTEAVEIDHVIPYSLCFDDTYNNKVVVFAYENRQKGNMTAYEYIKKSGRNLEEYEILVNNLIVKSQKRKKLLKEKISFEEAERYKKSNIIDNQEMCKLMYELVKRYFDFSKNMHFPKKVWTINGKVTSHIMKRLGLNKMRDGDIRHAIDATVVGIVTQDMIDKVTNYYQHSDNNFMNSQGNYIDIETGEVLNTELYGENYRKDFPEPWENFLKELDIRVNGESKMNMIKYLEEEEINTYESSDDLEPIFVSKMPKRKITGTAHLDTIRGLKEKNGELKTVIKTELKRLKLKNGEIDGYLEEAKRDDKLLYNALRERLIAFKGNAEDAFKEDFYKPRKDGSRGALVKKVKIESNATLGVKLNNNKGFAGNGDAVRIDVFYVENEGYYFVPIYVSDTIKNKLPNKACVSGKEYSEWKEMDDNNFIFSLYSNDLMYVEGLNNIKLNPIDKNEISKEVSGGLLAYYIKSDISNAQITIETDDGKFIQPSLGVKKLKKFEKYEVDVLGNYHKVKLPEKRMSFDI